MRVLEYDIVGQICPSTLLFALGQVNANADKLDAGEAIIRIKTDHRDATVTIPESVSNMGYSVNVNKVAGYYIIDIKAE